MRPALLLAMLSFAVLAACDRTVEPTTVAPTPFDANSFAGTFASEGMVVRIAADGTYTLSSHATNASPGTWSLKPDGRHIRLDPHAEGEDDRVYVVLDNDALRAANGPQVLRREAEAQ